MKVFQQNISIYSHRLETLKYKWEMSLGQQWCVDGRRRQWHHINMLNPMKFTQSLIDHGMREWIELKHNAVFEGWCYRLRRVLRPGAIDLAANVSQFFRIWWRNGSVSHQCNWVTGFFTSKSCGLKQSVVKNSFPFRWSHKYISLKLASIWAPFIRFRPSLVNI